jgi:hypothetical protein
MRVPCPAASKTAVTFMNSLLLLPINFPKQNIYQITFITQICNPNIFAALRKIKTDLRSTGRRKACLSLEKKPRGSGNR